MEYIYKVGDKVYFEADNGVNDSFYIDTIDYITPKGKIRLVKNNQSLFSNDGWEIKNSYHRSRFVLLTPELAIRYNNWYRRSKVTRTDFTKLSDEIIQEIYNILKRKE